MRSFLLLFSIFLIILSGSAFISGKPFSPDTEKLRAYFNSSAHALADSVLRLSQVLGKPGKEYPESISRAKAALKGARTAYKKISLLLDAFFPASSRAFNAPDKMEIEEPYYEFDAPAGFQHLETFLFKAGDTGWQAERDDVAIMLSSARDLPALMFEFSPGMEAIDNCIRKELIRIASLYCTGYDAPYLKSGLAESVAALTAIDELLVIAGCGTGSGHSPRPAVSRALEFLKINSDFDNFDRLAWLADFMLPIENKLSHWESGMGLPVENENFPERYFLSRPGEVIRTREAQSGLTDLGADLFKDKSLSGNNSRSCADCHQPSRYFSDGLVKNRTTDSIGALLRNSPTLLYARYQSALFWDGRAHTMIQQIDSVLRNRKEMGCSPEQIEQRLNSFPRYAGRFAKLFPREKSGKIRFTEVCEALAAFVNGLHPFRSSFDNYLAGDRKALTGDQIAGFNLFAGKAQCATCHFIPLFNGVTPPDFNKSEFEILGVPGNTEKGKLQTDKDAGRFDVFPIGFNRHAFKTPTVRNVAETAPYMHNGFYRTLDEVVEFYNQGGGAGLGLDVPNQTLSSAKLGLSEKEKFQIVQFLNALTDPGPSTENLLPEPVNKRKAAGRSVVIRQ